LAGSLLETTALVQVIQRQFARDDFDENVLASTEALAILLQLHPMFISQLNAGVLNLLLQFCANARHLGSAGEDEAAHNAFNLISMIGMNAKKLFSGGKSSVKSTFAVIGIIESPLTVLSTESVSFERVIRKFVENESEKVDKLIDMSVFVSNQQTETDEDDPTIEALMKCCASIVVLFGFAVDVVQLAIVRAVNASEILDFETILETAELRADDSPGIAERIRIGVRLLKQVTADA
jgi:hypothetical protein